MMLALIVVLASTALVTALVVNLIITLAREHQEHGCPNPAERIVADATNVSLDVREFTRQVGGQQ